MGIVPLIKCNSLSCNCLFRMTDCFLFIFKPLYCGVFSGYTPWFSLDNKRSTTKIALWATCHAPNSKVLILPQKWCGTGSCPACFDRLVTAPSGGWCYVRSWLMFYSVGLYTALKSARHIWNHVLVPAFAAFYQQTSHFCWSFGKLQYMYLRALDLVAKAACTAWATHKFGAYFVCFANLGNCNQMR